MTDHQQETRFISIFSGFKWYPETNLRMFMQFMYLTQAFSLDPSSNLELNATIIERLQFAKAFFKRVQCTL